MMRAGFSAVVEATRSIEVVAEVTGACVPDETRSIRRAPCASTSAN
jgi:hypothetical protein